MQARSPSRRRLARCGVLAAFGLSISAALLVPGSAEATFPGSDGSIVYSYVHLNEDGDVGGLRVHGPRAADKPKSLTRSAADQAPAFSPNGRLITFEGNRSEAESAETHIYVMSAGGSGVRQLTEGPYKDSDPAFSPSGKEIVFDRSTTAPRTTHIFEVNLAGGEPRQLSSGSSRDSEPVFTPDGRRIIFVSNRRPGDLDDIFSMSPTGTGVRLLVGGPGNDDQPDVAPNGREIAFASTRDGGPNLFLATIAGRHLRQITQSRGGCFGSNCFGHPAFSPDGTHIAYVATGRFASDIIVTRSDGQGRPKQFQEGGSEEEGFGTVVGAPAWGPVAR